ncbi:hypothetical protein A3860_11120 [Niastella vici]|uniref:Uncharacterized protein n=1 Tax=Niastella vici TaxID=1703345 RepID=A0A1V9FFH5_9BACT|nr:hypothetical protein [Niastella vici]OQP57108.1 hypothetical protein A3860_11120 [Niastella vici]
MNHEKGKSGLTKKIAIIVGAAIAALGVQKTSATALPELPAADGKNIDYAKDAAKPKKMPVLKLNPQNPGQSKFVAQHNSHSSHSSHSSHHSHYSGAMFA